ncbi:MAG: dihydroorotate dehydrogenase electron transfer subunit [Oscillospiraceae bacterium]
MNQTTLTLAGRRQLTYDVWELILVGDTSAVTAPGQFVNLQLEGSFLRRPISICDWDDGSLTLLVRVVGDGTAQLCNSPLGTGFDTLVGLGNGFDPARAVGTPLCIGGGIGAAPLYGLAKRMAVPPAVALGFNTKDDALYSKEFTDLGCSVFLSTVDGSLGLPGFVTELLPHIEGSYGFCCGPEAMLRAVAQSGALTGGQFSLEARMGCGFGACMGCSCQTKTGSKRICKDGPVLDMEELVW